MADTRRARAERRAALATRVAQTAEIGGRPPCSPSPAANAATDPARNEQQASSQHPSVRREGRTATPSLTPAASSSHARRAPTDAHAALLLARELLHYRPVDDLYEDWLARITELVSAAGGSPLSSLSLPHPPFRAGGEDQEVPPPHPPQEGALAPRHAAPRRDPPHPAPAQQERSCQEIPRPQEGARALPAPRAKIASLHLHTKTPRCSERRRAVIPMSKPSTSKRHRWPQQAAVPSPSSYAASHGQASSGLTCPLATMARRTPRSSCSSTSYASKPPTETKGSWRTGSPWRSRTGPAPGS